MKKLPLSWFLIFFLGFSLSFSGCGNDQNTILATIEIDAGEYNRQNSIVSLNLEGTSYISEIESIVAYLKDGDSEKLVLTQVDNEKPTVLWLRMPSLLKAGEKAQIVLKKGKRAAHVEAKVQVIEQDGNLVLRQNGKNVLQYNFVEAPLPKGIDKVFLRAGFIHPLWSPKGEVLTRIQPPDHYHHYGIWNPWTHTRYKGRPLDFWNLKLKHGTVRPTTINSTSSAELFGSLSVSHDHVVFDSVDHSREEVALHEDWDIRAWNISENEWLIDFTSTLECATDSVFKIEEYRYQGFGFRATEKWDDETVTLLTSEGKNKADGNSTRTRWCDVNGISEDGTAGVLFITHPANYNYPEPIRIWPVGSNGGKENVFFNFNPAMDRDWILEPGKQYRLRYRMYVYDGKLDPQKAEQLWAEFAVPPKVSIIDTK